jgi:hypothetical protein
MQEALSIKSSDWAIIEADADIKFKNDLIAWSDSKLLGAFENQNAEALKSPERKKLWNRLTSQLSDSTFRPNLKNLTHLASMIEPKDMTEPDAPFKFILDFLFKGADTSRILTVVKQGAFGSVEINRFIGNHLKRQLKLSEGSAGNLFSGAMIIMSRNDYSKNLFNGDLGVVLSDPDGIFRAYFKRADSYIGWRVDLLSEWDPAYALTVHKCQGSEFDDVMVVLPRDEKHRLLTRQIIYTAVTRAKKRVFIYGKPSALANALHRKIKRESGLTWQK